MTIVMPKRRLEEYGQARDTHFPEGLWRVSLETAREREFPDFIADAVAEGRNSGYSSGDGEILGLQFGSARNMENEETTNQKLFVDLVTRDGNATIEDTTIPERSWQLANSQTLLALFAQATGALDEVEDENGETFVTIADGFLDALRQGHLDDTIVEVYHRPWRSKAGKSGVEVRVRNVMPAV